MKNKKFKIICLIALLLVILGSITAYLVITNKGSSISTITEISKSSLNNDDEDVNWSKYKTYDVTLDGDLNITKAGVYNISGSTTGNITIDVSDNVKLILNGVEINSKDSPAIVVENSKVVLIELADGTTSKLSDSKDYSSNYSDYDGVIYSNDDLYFTGSGTLEIVANHGDGIVSKDDLKISSGTYIITSSDDGIRGTDSVYIKDGNFTINSTGDGIKSTKENEQEKGFIYISSGTFNINSKLDGISAISKLVIDNGEFNITTGGGSPELQEKTGFENTKSSSSNDSQKGIKCDGDIYIKNGTFTLDTYDDGIHSNTNTTIDYGTINIKSGDDAIHSDGLLEINNGTFDITAAEGLEATYVKINDGTINISASDDGINAGNKSKEYETTIEINGGYITIKMGQGDTDGIDSNGNIIINGGTIDVTCNSPFDYDGTAEYNGGKLIVNGEETTTITNQMMGGFGGNGGPQGGMQRGEMPDGEMPQDGNMRGNRGQRRQQ